ncbi:MAG: hypothetical protein QG597_5108 [Actinomycetota bacterium]|nr:hypothetical protein [Actinomycetota bacterium]
MESNVRLSFVDNLRTVLTCLVVLHHVAVTYSGLGTWYYTEKPTSAAVGLGLTVLLMVDQAWFMGAFFLLSGYFTPASYDRKGAHAFLRDRVIRLGIPLVVCCFVVSPVLLIGRYPEGSPLDGYLSAIGPGPLWFVLVLLALDVGYTLARRVTRRRPAQVAAATGVDEVFPIVPPASPAFRAVASLVAGLALVTYAWRIVVPIGFWVPVVGLPTAAYLPQYLGFFAVGTIAYRRGWLHAVTARMGAAGLGLVVGATLVLLPLSLAAGPAAMVGRGTLNSLCYALWDSSVAVGACLALLALFRSRFDGTGPLRHFLSQHTYAVYVSHAIVVTAVGHVLGDVAVPTLAKVGAAGLVALPACFAFAGLLRRLPSVRHVL